MIGRKNRCMLPKSSGVVVAYAFSCSPRRHLWKHLTVLSRSVLTPQPLSQIQRKCWENYPDLALIIRARSFPSLHLAALQVPPILHARSGRWCLCAPRTELPPSLAQSFGKKTCLYQRRESKPMEESGGAEQIFVDCWWHKYMCSQSLSHFSSF